MFVCASVVIYFWREAPKHTNPPHTKQKNKKNNQKVVVLRELRQRQEKLNKKAGVAGAAAIPGGPVATVTARELLSRFQTHMSEPVIKQRLRERCFCEPHGAGDSTWALRPDAKVWVVIVCVCVGCVALCCAFVV